MFGKKLLLFSLIMSMNEGAETKVRRTMVAGIHLDEIIAAAGSQGEKKKEI